MPLNITAMGNNHNYTSNEDLAAYLDGNVGQDEQTDILTSMGYNPQPINVDDVDLDANLEELTEAIAENAHDTWARARMDEGWTYGPVRNDQLKQHPDLVPYSQLPDSEKEYDRLMAMNTLRLVLRLGFDILHRNKI